MCPKILNPFLFSLLFVSFLNAQPVSNDPFVVVTQLGTIKNSAVRIAKCKHDNHFYYITFQGDIYKLIEDAGVWSDTLVATQADHGMNYLQGIAFYDSTMYVVGNLSSGGAPGNGIVAKATISGSTYSWSNVFTTEPYATTATLYAHAFSSIAVTDDGDSLYISSGSRTDHGEVQSVNGLFPGLREVDLTTILLKVPVTLSEFTMPDDSAFLDSMGFVFARGLRNNFDMAFNKYGDLIGVENSGDRDDPDEINWLSQGNHYGFPWRMGGNLTGQQFADYDDSLDLLLNPNSAGALGHYFYNDSTYPPMPAITFSEPIKNYGPYADKYRDSTDGFIYDASDMGGYITSITTHRSPLGLVFDRNEYLDGAYKGDGFMLCYTPGCPDSSGFNPGLGLGPFLEPGQELLHLEFTKDSIDGYSVNIYPLVTGFTTPVDAELDSNVIYIIENRYLNSFDPARLWKVEFPVIVNENELSRVNILVYPNPAKDNIYIKTSGDIRNYFLFSVTGELILQGEINGRNSIDVSGIRSGVYSMVTTNGKQITTHKIVIMK